MVFLLAGTNKCKQWRGSWRVLPITNIMESELVVLDCQMPNCNSADARDLLPVVWGRAVLCQKRLARIIFPSAKVKGHPRPQRMQKVGLNHNSITPRTD